MQDNTEVSISEYLEVLRRRWVWLVLAPVVLVGISLFNDLRADPVYSASAQLLLRSRDSENIFSVSGSGPEPARALQNELRIINSRRVRIAVQEEYGRSVSVRALAGGEDDVIVVSARASDASEAAERVNVYTSVYQRVRLEALLDDLTTAKEIIQQQIDDFQAQVDEVNAPLQALDDEIRLLNPEDPRYAQLLNDRQRIKELTDATRNEAQNQLNDYQQRLQLLQLSERLTTSGGVQILNPATVPSSPVSPTPVRNAVQAGIVGIFVGLALAFLRDQLDDSLRGKSDVERAVRGLPTIALVPNDPELRESRRYELTTLNDPMSTTSEAYRGLRTAIQYAMLNQPLKVFQVTSPGAGEGKTTLVSNLAMTFAQAGKQVAVLGGDLRKPRLQDSLQVDGSRGFTSVMLGDLTLDEAVQTSPLHPNVAVLASGMLPPNPSELLSHERTGKIIGQLTERYDIVFIDSPPVLPVTDALVVSRWVDASIIVAAANRTTRRSMRRTNEMLRQVGSPVMGSVLVGVPGEEAYGSLYEYYGYKVSRSNSLLGRFSRKQPSIPVIAEESLPDQEGQDPAESARV